MKKLLQKIKNKARVMLFEPIKEKDKVFKVSHAFTDSWLYALPDKTGGSMTIINLRREQNQKIWREHILEEIQKSNSLEELLKLLNPEYREVLEKEIAKELSKSKSERRI